ncbi:hypothetical protein I7I50_08830 [Histoplasma capsulatum G186AR]|uniref:Uncharacterized protein n=1 Tax=Ajellomyces capsulatus TaxID=5037 RepID=A0A8H7YP30_AJECA|nr:hypothetical protein I7I52_06344 [Histoplasma capsulatum]QSS73897.1 hypothetical protein I7I50_08830 [Histoplasma capsulatum G186AR]
MKSFSTRTRQRANTTGGTLQGPRLNITDALPHSGLQGDGQTSTSNVVPKRNNTFNTHAGPPREEWKASPAPDFDFQLSASPAQSPSFQRHESTASDDGTAMIGMAVGSPTMYRTVQYTPSYAVSPPAIGFDSMELVGSAESESWRPKPSKWKKISDFFKAKNSLQQQQQQLQQQPDVDFDQLQLHNRPTSSHESRDRMADSHDSRNLEASSESHTPWDDLEFEHRMGKLSRKSGKDVSKSPGGKEQRKLVKYAEPPKPNKKAHHQAKPVAKPLKLEVILPGSLSGPEDVTGSLLNVEIPEVHMERYSVMFGSVLDKPTSTTLLASRSKTLNTLKTHYEEEELGHREITLPMRGTPPDPKSPTFTLFPAAPTAKPPKTPHNSNLTRQNIPLQQSNTNPRSPGTELNEKVISTKDCATPQGGTSSMATSSSSRSQWVSEGSSYLSMESTSPSSSDISMSSDEDEAVPFTYNKVVPISPDEPLWEILNPAAKLDPVSAKSKSVVRSQRLRTIKSEESFAAIEQPYSPSSKRMTGEEIHAYPKTSPAKEEARESSSTEFKNPSQPPNIRKTRSDESVVAMLFEEPHHIIPPAPLQPKSESKPRKPAPIYPTIDIEQWLPQPRPPPPQRKPPPTPPAPSPTIALPPVPVQPPPALPQYRTRPKPKSRPPPSTKDNANRQAMNAIEISVARSVSVTKKPKQVIVPMSAMRSDSLRRPDERFGEKRSATPTLISVSKGHEREKSQEVPIEVAQAGLL